MSIRPAKPSDAHAMARIYVETWQATYRGILPEGAAADLAPLEALIARSRQRAHQQVVRGVRSARFRRLLSRWRRFLQSDVSWAGSLGTSTRMPTAHTADGGVFGVAHRSQRSGSYGNHPRRVQG